ncbi:MAG TPA: diphthine synthase [Candidatus Aenigmarchaeota archaeon]|nr:diphthine synthase [Candidatus Aenigmarchaeota archaeon]
MLYLIGLGLYDEKDMTLRGLEAAKSCDKLYIERYTSAWHGLENLKVKLGKEIVEVRRKDLEEEQGKILEEAKSKVVGILVPGDPLVATTHIDILIQARKMGIKTSVVHAPSIYSAVGETGLFIYKFGKTTTIPFPEKGYEPQSPYDAIKENKERGLHTLCLLDIKERPMTPREALEYLLKIEEKRREKVITPGDKVIVFAVRERGSVTYDTVENLMKREFPTPAVIIIPGKLHSMEEEALK